MTELFSSGSEESQSDDSQETGHREPEKGDSPNPNSPIMTFGELLKLAREIGDGNTGYDESGTWKLKTPTSSSASDPSTTTWDVLTIPKKSGRKTRKMPENKHDIDLKGWNLFRAAEENRKATYRNEGRKFYFLGGEARTSLDIARALLEHGADVNGKNAIGSTPLHTAAWKDSLDVARLLIEKGANTDGIDLSWMDDEEDA